LNNHQLQDEMKKH